MRRAEQAGRALEHRYPQFQNSRVFNGGFELGGAFWRLKRAPSPDEEWSYSIVSFGEAYTGEYACNLIRKPLPKKESRRPGPALSQTLRLKAGTDYRLGFHARSTGVAMVEVRIDLADTREKLVFAGLEWELNQVPFKTGPNELEGTVTLTLEKGDDVFFDDIRVEETDPELL